MPVDPCSTGTLGGMSRLSAALSRGRTCPPGSGPACRPLLCWSVPVLLVAGTLVLSSCGGQGDAGAGAGGELTLTDGWAKAASPEEAMADSVPMTALFGTLTNEGEEQVVLVGGSSPHSEEVELHVTVDDGAGGRVMQEAEDGFTIEPGAELELAPGADHVMLIGLTEALENGASATVVLQSSDGQDWEFTIPVRTFAGAEEHYRPDDGDESTGMP